MLPCDLRPVLALALALTAVSAVHSADPPLDSPEQTVLDKWVGNWRVNYKAVQSEWTPEQKTLSAELVVNRVVGSRFVQETSEHSDKSSACKILAYDGEKKCYRGWWFSSTGQTKESTGKWDDRAKTMIWTSVDQAPFLTTVKERFLDDDNLEWSVNVSDNKNKVLFRMEGKSTRVKPLKK